MCAHRLLGLPCCADHDNPLRVYDRNVLPIALPVSETLAFWPLTSWHHDCNVLGDLLKTLRRALSSLPGISAAMGRP